jgi:fluoride exporter
LNSPILSVALGGALGAAGRYGILQLLGTVDDGGLPWGTFAANALGSLLLGAVVCFAARGAFSEGQRLFLAVGLLGGFTTFSFFSYENLELLRDDRFAALIANTLGQLVLGIALATTGFAAADRMHADSRRR